MSRSGVTTARQKSTVHGIYPVLIIVPGCSARRPGASVAIVPGATMRILSGPTGTVPIATDVSGRHPVVRQEKRRYVQPLWADMTRQSGMVIRISRGYERTMTGAVIPEIREQDTNPVSVGNSPASPHPVNRETDAGPMHGGREDRCGVFRRWPDGGR